METAPAPRPTRALWRLIRRREPNMARCGVASSSSSSRAQLYHGRCAGIGLQGIFGRRGVDRDRIAAGEATEASIALARRAQEPVETEIPEGVSPEMAANLLEIPAMGNQALALAHVDPEVTGVRDRRRRDSEVDRGGATPSQQVDDLGHRVAADDAVVDDHHPLVLHRSP